MAPSETNTFGTFVRDARKRADLSLSEAAELIGCTKSHLWEIERGDANNPTIKTIAGISTALNLDLADLATIAACSAPGSDFRLAVSKVVEARRGLAEAKQHG